MYENVPIHEDVTVYENTYNCQNMFNSENVSNFENPVIASIYEHVPSENIQFLENDATHENVNNCTFESLSLSENVIFF